MNRTTRSLDTIMLGDCVGLMSRLETENVEPMAEVSDRHGVGTSKTGNERFAHASREDVLFGLRPSLSNEEAVANAPDADENFFRVPKVIER